MLGDIAAASNEDPDQTVATTRVFMAKVGDFVDVVAIGNTMDTFAQNGNFAAIDAVTDYLTDAQKDQFIGLHSLSDTLNYIALHTIVQSAATAIAADNLMSKLGASVDARAGMSGSMPLLR